MKCSFIIPNQSPSYEKEGNIRLSGCGRQQEVFEVLAIFHLVKGHRRQAVELVAKRGCDGFPQSSFAAKRGAAEDDQVLEMRSTSIL